MRSVICKCCCKYPTETASRERESESVHVARQQQAGYRVWVVVNLPCHCPAAAPPAPSPSQVPCNTLSTLCSPPVLTPVPGRSQGCSEGGVAVVQGAGAERGVHMCPGDAGTSFSRSPVRTLLARAGAGPLLGWCEHLVRRVPPVITLLPTSQHTADTRPFL